MSKQLKTLRDELVTIMSCKDMTASAVMDYIDTFIAEEQKKYETSKDKKVLTFGKFKGFTVKEVAAAPKGKSYLEWLLGQTWCTEDKFQYIYDGCKELNIKKKGR